MPARKRLTEFEKGQIVALSSQGFSCRAVAIRIERSKSVVNNFLRLKDSYGKKNSGGRPKKLSPREERRVLKLASTGKFSSTQLINETQIKVCKKTICNVLNHSGKFEYCAKLVQPKLLPRHKEQRLAFAQRVMSWDDKWIEVVFSDEKKFNLDGPDGWKSYWHDLRKEKAIHSKQHSGGGSLMVWGCFGFNGVGVLEFISGRMSGEDYRKLLQVSLIPVGPAIGGENWVFQHDNAPIHCCKIVKQFLSRSGTSVLDWPAKSAELNPIKNLWGDLARRVPQGVFNSQWNETGNYETIVQNGSTTMTLSHKLHDKSNF